MKKIIFYLNAVLILASACYSLYGNDRIAEPKKDNVVSATEKKDRENGSRKRPFMRSGEHRKRPQGRFMRGPGRNGFFGRFSEEEREELQRLSLAGDREGFGRKLRELRKKYATEEDKKVYLLEEKYHAVKTAEEKDLIRKELREAVFQQVKRRNDLMLKQIAAVEEKLQKLKEFHARNVKNADTTAEKITTFLCTPPAERKNFRRTQGKK